MLLSPSPYHDLGLAVLLCALFPFFHSAFQHLVPTRPLLLIRDRFSCVLTVDKRICSTLTSGPGCLAWALCLLMMDAQQDTIINPCLSVCYAFLVINSLSQDIAHSYT